MRVTLPDRVPMYYVGVFATVLLLLQQVDHTNVFFSLCCFFFVVVAGLAFNIAGGLSTPSGGYVFFYSMLTVIIGLVWKVVLGEPAETNLLEPRLTILVFMGGICAMLVAVIVSRRLTRKRPLLADLATNNLQNASTGCLIFGVLLFALAQVVQRQNGTFFSALLQLNRFCEMAIILGVTYQIRKSGGRSSVNFPALAASTVLWVYGGLLGFSKQAIFTPFICWLLAAGAQRYRISRAQAFASVVILSVLVRYLVPYAQYGRAQAGRNSAIANAEVSIELLSDLGTVRERYLEGERANLAETRNGYFNTPQGLFDRLQMLYPDSTLIESTERLGQFGLFPILADFENLIPHVFWANKPAIKWGNVFAHDTATPLDEEDETTGISYSPSGEGYRLAKWTGVLLVAPILWTMTFVWFDSLCGDVRKSPWGLLALTLFSHTAPEGMLDSCIYMMGYGAFAIIFAALTAAYVMPHLGMLFSGPGGRNRFIKTEVRGLPRRVSTLEGSEETAT